MTKLNKGNFTIRFKRGLAAAINTAVTKSLAVEGEPHWTTDDNRLYVYDAGGDVMVEFKKRLFTATTKTADYAATANDEVIKFTSNATLTLPAATGSGQHYLVRASGCTVVVDGNGTDTINEELTQTLFAGDSVQIIDDGSGLWGVY